MLSVTYLCVRTNYSTSLVHVVLAPWSLVLPTMVLYKVPLLSYQTRCFHNHHWSTGPLVHWVLDPLGTGTPGRCAAWPQGWPTVPRLPRAVDQNPRPLWWALWTDIVSSCANKCASGTLGGLGGTLCGVVGTRVPGIGLLMSVWGFCRPLPLHGWSALGGLHRVLWKQHVWAAGDTPQLMLLEQGLALHPVATGLAGWAILCVVAAFQAEARRQNCGAPMHKGRGSTTRKDPRATPGGTGQPTMDK